MARPGGLPLLGTAEQRDAYRSALGASLAVWGHAIVATFAPDGPETCSDLPVCRHDAPALIEALGFSPGEITRTLRRIHVTP
jgi:hypothetical protein